MVMNSILCALLLASAPVATPQAASVEAEPAEVDGNAKRKEGPFDPAQMMAVFDKLFPNQPDPLPQRLALSRVTVQAIFPDGTYARLMDGVMDSFVDRIMVLSAADFGAKGKAGKPPSNETLRQQALKDDPHFEERMRITERVFTEELSKMAKIIEPKLREGLARSMARRFDERQLTDINGFLATDSGRAFGSQSMAMWIDPDVMRAMISSFPEVIEAMPGAMKRLETETAHLPKPKKKLDEGKKPVEGKE
jgi:hypothetical protein